MTSLTVAPFIILLLLFHCRQFEWMHPLAMRIIIAARCECSIAKWAGKFAYARVLNHVCGQRVLQFERFPANLTAEWLQVGVLHFNVVAQALPIQCRVIALRTVVTHSGMLDHVLPQAEFIFQPAVERKAIINKIAVIYELFRSKVFLTIYHTFRIALDALLVDASSNGMSNYLKCNAELCMSWDSFYESNKRLLSVTHFGRQIVWRKCGKYSLDRAAYALHWYEWSGDRLIRICGRRKTMKLVGLREFQ